MLSEVDPVSGLRMARAGGLVNVYQGPVAFRLGKKKTAGEPQNPSQLSSSEQHSLVILSRSYGDMDHGGS